jgi:hypothetical protein
VLLERLHVLYGRDAFVRVEPVLAGNYEAICAAAWDALVTTHVGNGREEPVLPCPQLHVVHSMISRAASTREGKVWSLIYDQHLGQILSQLTRLVHGQALTEAVDAYLHKLFGQRLLVAGEIVGALAMWVRSQEGELMPTESGEQLIERLELVCAQEAFVIAHELTHVLLNLVPDIRVELSKEVFDFVQRIPPPGAEVVEAYPDFWRDSVVDVYARYGSTIDREAIEAQEYETPRDPSTELRSNPQLLEEVICDYAGAIASAQVCKVMARIRFERSFTAAGMALHHLRLLQMLDSFSRPEGGRRVSEEAYDSVTRLSVHRGVIPQFCAWVTELWGCDADAVREDVRDFNISHARVVLDPILFVLGFADFYEEATSAKKAAGVADEGHPLLDFEQRASVRERLGFARTSPRQGL